MGVEPSEKLDRNSELLKDHASGMSFVDMVSKYKITSQRIYQIVNKPKKK